MSAKLPHSPRMRVHHIGLDARDALLLESALRMQSSTLELTFGPSLPDDPVDVLFVNGDNARAMDRWFELSMRRPELLGVIVAASNPLLPDMHWVARPLSVRSCSDVIRSLTAAHDSSANRQLTRA